MQQHSQSIYVVIVLYKINLFDAESYKTLIAPNNITHFLVYDNSPQKGYTDEKSLPTGVTYINDMNNGGLAKAYNAGARIAQEKGYERVLLLDQDTIFASNAWECYLQNASYNGLTAPLIRTNKGDNFSPVCIGGWFAKAAQGIKPYEYSLFKYAVVNSGCCIPTKLFIEAGGYAEGVILDFADFQFQLRLRRLAPKFRIINTTAIQDFSNDCTDVAKVKNRFVLYLKSAVCYKSDSKLMQFKHHCEVFKHTVSLSVRTRSLFFINNFFTQYLIK